QAQAVRRCEEVARAGAGLGGNGEAEAAVPVGGRLRGGRLAVFFAEEQLGAGDRLPFGVEDAPRVGRGVLVLLLRRLGFGFLLGRGWLGLLGGRRRLFHGEGLTG